MLKRKIMSNENGFTLIELIIVIAIIAALASYVIAKQPKVMESQRQAKHLSTISTLESAFDSFAIHENLTGVEDSKGNEDLTLGKVGATDTSIDINVNRDNFDDDDEGTVTLLMPITERHPLVKQGYINKAPENPWNSSKQYQDYVYVADFKVNKKLITNPDGTKDQDSVVQPVIRLMKIDSSTLDREDFILVVNNKTLSTTEADNIKNDSLKSTLGLYGYDFESQTSGDDDEDEPEFEKLSHIK